MPLQLHVIIYSVRGLFFILLCPVGLELTCIYRTAAMDICTGYFLQKSIKCLIECSAVNYEVVQKRIY